MLLPSLGTAYRALVIGASGAIGSAFVEALQADAQCAHVVPLSRRTHPGFELGNEASIAAAAVSLSAGGPYALMIDATGALVIDGHGPEKRLSELSAERLLAQFTVNAMGPALLLKHFMPHLAPGRAIYAKLSARVGSISDNQRGGWYGYRSAKAALNMLLQTAAIECAVRQPQAVIAALQPGTVASPLSAPFTRGTATLTPAESVAGMLAVLDTLQPTRGAQFRDYRGALVPW